MANKKQQILYGVSDKMPLVPLLLSSAQHVLMLVSVALTLPVAIAEAAGLDVFHSGAFLAATLFGCGVVTILQSLDGKFLGSGYQSFSTTDSAAIGCCVMAAELGGLPLVLGMTIFAAVLKFILGNFAYNMRKLFPAEATGTLVFIVGINLIPTAFKFFLGTSDVARPEHILVAALTFLCMVVCSLFVKKLKPYVALIGIVFGYILSLIFGVFDMEAFHSLEQSSLLTIPVYPEWAFSFDISMVIPFAIITLAAIVDNIGDLSATQMAADPERTKPDWKSITKGIRSSGLGNALTALIGSPLQNTATANVGVARASGIVSRSVAFVAAAMLIAISFFPKITGFLSIIPQPVLGALIMYSMCYIMAGGFITLQSRDLDDRKIFTIFLTLAAAISTLIPGLYSFLPQMAQTMLVSPMVMGTCVLVVMSLICKIGTKKQYDIICDVNPDTVPELEAQIRKTCTEWGADRVLCRKLQIAVGALCESLFELDPECSVTFNIAYDELEISVLMGAKSPMLTEQTLVSLRENEGEQLHSSTVTIRMLENMFDSVKVEYRNSTLIVRMSEDL